MQETACPSSPQMQEPACPYSPQMQEPACLYGSHPVSSPCAKDIEDESTSDQEVLLPVLQELESLGLIPESISPRAETGNVSGVLDVSGLPWDGAQQSVCKPLESDSFVLDADDENDVTQTYPALYTDDLSLLGEPLEAEEEADDVYDTKTNGLADIPEPAVPDVSGLVETFPATGSVTLEDMPDNFTDRGAHDQFPPSDELPYMHSISL